MMLIYNEAPYIKTKPNTVNPVQHSSGSHSWEVSRLHSCLHCAAGADAAWLQRSEQASELSVLYQREKDTMRNNKLPQFFKAVKVEAGFKFRQALKSMPSHNWVKVLRTI